MRRAYQDCEFKILEKSKEFSVKNTLWIWNLHSGSFETCLIPTSLPYTKGKGLSFYNTSVSRLRDIYLRKCKNARRDL